MPSITRVLVLSALAIGLSHAAASACEEASAKAVAKATAKAKATAHAHAHAKAECQVKAIKVANLDMKSCLDVKVKVVNDVKTKTCNIVDVKVNTPINAQPRRSGWSPGHLIEPDSMKLGPEGEVQSPGKEQWVIISGRTGEIHFRQYPRGGRNIEGRTLQQHGP